MKTILNFNLKSHFFSINLICFILMQLLSVNEGVSCSLTETYLINGSEYACIGDSRTIASNNCSAHQSVLYEWHVERCSNNNQYGSQCTNFSSFQVLPPQPPGPLNYTFLVAGTYRFKLVVLDAQTLNILAVPCSSSTGPGTCDLAIVNVHGADVPFFNVTSVSCTYDAQSGTYSETISIDPRVNHTVTSTVNSGNGTSLDIDWGDGASTNLPFVLSVGSNIVQHTYTWNQMNNQHPNYVISVQAASGACPGQSYSRSYQPIPNFAFIIPDVIEADCHQQVVCFNGTEAFEFFHWLDSNGAQFGDNQQCLTFTEPGTYTLVADNPGGCPFIFTYEVVFSPTSIGVLYSNDSYLQPGLPLDLNVNNTTAGFIIYEIYSGSCNPTPVWVPFAFGDAASMMNYTVPWYVTQNFLPCMLNGNFEFCIRAKVFCEEPPSLTTPGAVTNEICFKVCAGSDSGGGEPHEGLVTENGSLINAELEERLLGVERENEVEVYPNPASEKLMVETELPVEEKMITLGLKNLNGQTILKKDYQVGNTPMFQQEIAVSGIPAGMYILELSGTSVKFSTLIVIDN